MQINGKNYVEVHERIREFRDRFPNGVITTEILEHIEGKVVMKATVSIEGQIRATGHAYEVEGSTFINKTSYIENCETSAIGRALGVLGIGILDSVASANEVVNAINNQKKEPHPDGKAKIFPEPTPVTDEDANLIAGFGTSAAINAAIKSYKEKGLVFNPTQQAKIKARREQLEKEGK